MDVDMIDTKDILECVRAIELLHYGVDITQLDTLKQYWNIKEKKLQSRLSPNIGDFLCQWTPEVAEFIQWPLGLIFARRGQAFTAETNAGDEPINCTVDLDTMKQVMTILKQKGWCKFDGINPAEYDTEYEARLKKMKEEWDYHDTSDAKEMLQNLSNDAISDNLNCLLSLCEYGEEATKQILASWKDSPQHFEIKTLRDYYVHDNRIYIKIPEFDKNEFDIDVDDVKYLVISRNVYDYFFCSYGSEIQSCYSLTSTHYGFYGMVALSACKGNFIVYLTTGKPNKCNVIAGTKWYVPRMLTRSWGWLGENGELFLDRSYTGNSVSRYESQFRKLIFKYIGNDTQTATLPTNPLKYAEDMKNWHDKHQFRFYPDSIKVRDFKYYGVCYGDRCFVGNGEPFNKTMYNKAQYITEVPKGFKYLPHYEIVDGVITELRVCPITYLPLKPDEVRSKYAKFFKEPVSKLAILTYCDGYYKVDAFNNGDRYKADNISIDMSTTSQPSYKDGGRYRFYNAFSCDKKIPIKVFKESIAGIISNTDLDTVLVRYIEDDRVTYVKYKGKK